MKSLRAKEGTGWGRGTALLMLAAFGAYFCMYAFRKPVTVTQFQEIRFLGTAVDLKTALLIGQVVGYALSKYLGILVCSTLSREARARTLVGFILFAEASLVLFAVAPGAWRVAAMFLNGLPLGMVWGLVVRYLEGRRTAELLLAALSLSFIVSSGIVKDVGFWIMHRGGVTEAWMPAATGALFLVPFCLFVLMLERAPDPDATDEALRVHRKPMTREERHGFVGRYGMGLLPLIVAYFFLTAYRDFRDNYGIEIFRELGYLDTPGLFTRSELPAGVAVMGALALLVLIRDNRQALLATYGLMLSGMGIILTGTLLFRGGALDGMGWMILVGVGSYLAYVPVGAVLFERLTAASGTAGTAVFGIYIADAAGYTGSVGVQLFKDLGSHSLSRLVFFDRFSLFLALFGGACFVLSMAWTFRSLPRRAVAYASGLMVALLLIPTGARSQEGPVLAEVPRPSAPWPARVDRLLEAGRPGEAMVILEHAVATAPEDPEARWRAARGAWELGVLGKTQDVKNAWFRTGVEHARRALAESPDDSEVLRWAIATVGSLANAPGVGPRETARLADETWALANKLLELAPDDPVAHSALGSLHAEIMTLTAFERFAARIFLGGEALGSANWRDALTHQRRAVELDPGRILYRLELGKALAWQGRETEAVQELSLALELPVRTPVDAEHLRQVIDQLSKLGGPEEG